MELRVGFAFSRTWYVVNQWELAAVTGSGPATGGFVVQSSALVGAHHRLGSWSAATEAGVGVRDLSPVVDGLPDARTTPSQAAYLAIQPKLDYWLSPTFSIGVGASLASDASTSVGLVVGAHLMPYDMSR